MFTFGFFNSLNHDRTYNAEQMSSLFDGIITDGVFSNIGDMMAVRATEPASMYVTVGTGRAWFNSTWSHIDTEYELKVEQSELVLPRIDAVVLEVNHNISERSNYLKVVKGIASSDPQPPVMEDSEYVHQHALAYIYVDPNVNSISGAKITNNVGMDNCPLVTGILRTTPITSLFGKWEGEFDDWSVDKQTEFLDWFEDLRITLDGDVAGNLLNRIIKLEEENRRMRSTTDIIFTVSNWTYGSPYTQTVRDEDLADLTEADRPIIQAVLPDGFEGDPDDYFEQAGYISRIDTVAGGITAQCINERPTMDIVLAVKGR